MQCFRSFHTAERTIEGIGAMHVTRKGQVKRLDGRDAAGQARFIEGLFGIAFLAEAPATPLRASNHFLQHCPCLITLLPP